MATRHKGAGAALSHVDESGRVRMVDVSAKDVTAREAVARGHISISADALELIRAGRIAKGDPLQAARIAGIMAAKRTADLIPLCHPLPLSHVDVVLTPTGDGYDIEATARTTAQTGVEMEALTAVSVAALTIYDMVKAADKTMEIGGSGSCGRAAAVRGPGAGDDGWNLPRVVIIPHINRCGAALTGPRWRTPPCVRSRDRPGDASRSGVGADAQDCRNGVRARLPKNKLRHRFAFSVEFAFL